MKIAVIGVGAMGGTTVEGLVKSQCYKKEDIFVSDLNQEVLKKFDKLGVNITTDNRMAAASADVVIVVVKPWFVEEVLRGLTLSDKQSLIVVAAGVKSEHIREWSKKDRFFLAIPNIAISQLASMTFLVPVNASPEETSNVKAMFDSVGTTLITDEQHLAAGTTLASCGIAYAMRYVRAASEGGVELGFKADDAKDIVLQTMLGAVKLLQSTGMHPEQAIDMVTTPGGVTIKGLNEMEHAGFTSAVIRGLKAGLK